MVHVPDLVTREPTVCYGLRVLKNMLLAVVDHVCWVAGANARGRLQAENDRHQRRGGGLASLGHRRPGEVTFFSNFWERR